MALIDLEELTPRAEYLMNICKAYTSLTPRILKHEVRGEQLMTVWFKGDEIPTKEQCGRIYEDLRNAEGVEVALCDHRLEGVSVAWSIYFK